MSRLLQNVKTAVLNECYLVSWHADERCEERGISELEIVFSIEDATLVKERPTSTPNPSVVMRQILADGSEVEVIWSWLSESGRAKLVTVYFLDSFP